MQIAHAPYLKKKYPIAELLGGIETPEQQKRRSAVNAVDKSTHIHIENVEKIEGSNFSIGSKGGRQNLEKKP